MQPRKIEMKLQGRCHCGAVAYEIDGEPINHTLCHCGDCRRHAGAPLVGWTMLTLAAVKTLRGQPKIYRSSEHGTRHFCADCGTGLFYTNDRTMPGLIDIQSATLDDPDALPPQDQIQIVERIRWMERAHELPAFERFRPRP
jgi:hypothetical protein